MFQRLFRPQRQTIRRITDVLYSAIVAAARQPVLYSEWQVPDTPLGRFEMMSLHMFLVQRRLNGATGMAYEVAQELIDLFFMEMDRSVRELGVGDMGVPKRMKRLARMHYGRTVSYANALDKKDRPALEAALTRNIRPAKTVGPKAKFLARYVETVSAALFAQPTDGLLAGDLHFPAANTMVIADEE